MCIRDRLPSAGEVRVHDRLEDGFDVERFIGEGRLLYLWNSMELIAKLHDKKPLRERVRDEHFYTYSDL